MILARPWDSDAPWWSSLRSSATCQQRWGSIIWPKNWDTSWCLYNTCIPYHHIISSYSEILLIMDFRWGLHSSRNLFFPHGQLDFRSVSCVIAHWPNCVCTTKWVEVGFPIRKQHKWFGAKQSHLGRYHTRSWTPIHPTRFLPGSHTGALSTALSKATRTVKRAGACSVRAALLFSHQLETSWNWGFSLNILFTSFYIFYTIFLHLSASWAKLFLPRVVSAACRWFWGIPMIWSTDQIQNVDLDIWLCPKMYQMIYSDLTWHVDQTSHLADQFLLCKKNDSQSCLKIASQKRFRRGAGNDLASQPHG